MNYLNLSETEFISSIKENRPLIMGILNITPDSFSDGGNYFNRDAAVKKAFELLEQGADILDIGGESTRPGAEAVSFDNEYERVIPVIEKILEIKPATIISVDTTKSKIAEEALKRGAAIINDISGLTFDEEMKNVIANYNAAAVIMHIKGNPKNMQQNPEYENVTEEVYEFLIKQAEAAQKAGVKKIIIDPGIGFGKNIQHNYELLKNLNKFALSGYPLLVGLSKKSFLGNLLNISVNERENATIITETVAVFSGADIVRTHNVSNAFQMKKIYNAVSNPEKI
ncbi:MAG: dihydropteroate synthase [Ignavibacteria bacterium]|nr:dihydropteroate synthase [Ignavibacteria bacterium]